MKVHVDMGLCEMHGQCEFVAPEVFSVETGELIFDPNPPEALRKKVELAIKACPQLAISIVE